MKDQCERFIKIIFTLTCDNETIHKTNTNNSFAIDDCMMVI